APGDHPKGEEGKGEEGKGEEGKGEEGKGEESHPVQAAGAISVRAVLGLIAGAAVLAL
ncbi:uncharacterized protein DNG_01770, partial [Cephalotrichum gorgonifer]